MERSGSSAATSADLLDDPPRERLRKVRSLGDLDEHVRRDERAVGLLPPHQRLDADDLRVRSDTCG